MLSARAGTPYEAVNVAMNERMDADLVVVGAGLAGLATAIAAAEHGCRVIVLEAAERVGGAAAYSGGMVWVPNNDLMARDGLSDCLDDAIAYIEAVAGDDERCFDRRAMRRWLETAPRAARFFEECGAVAWQMIPNMPDYYEVRGAKPEGRSLTAVFDGARLGAWRDRIRISPHFPVGTTYDELFGLAQPSNADATETRGFSSFRYAGASADVATYFSSSVGRVGAGVKPADCLSFGTGVVAGFVARAAAHRRISIRLSQRVRSLIVEDGAVVGARVETADGTVEYRGPVALATSGYDWNPALVSRYLTLDADDAGSVAPNTLRGDGIGLAEAVGAQIVSFPPGSVPMLPGFRIDDGTYRYSHEHAYPHCFLVDRSGQRFCDDSYYRDIAARALDPVSRRLPIYLIWDEQHHRRYGGVNTPPAGTYPSLVSSAQTLRELGHVLGIDGSGLERTAAEFNVRAVHGEDPVFGRGSVAAVRRFSGDPAHELHPNTAPVAQPPYFGLRCRLIQTGIGMSGIRIDGDGQALDAGGRPIAGLWAVGAAAAFTTSGIGYTSGYSLSRAIALGLLVGQAAASGLAAERMMSAASS